MPKLIEFFEQGTIKDDWKTQYIRYRLGRLKHQYWLINRKQKHKVVVDEYDYKILKNCQSGTTVFFGSAGYYLKDIFPSIEVIEQYPIVKTFYSDVTICKDRTKLAEIIKYRADNFAVVNNRADHWVDTTGLTEYFKSYSKIMNPGCRVFYSLRDTQIHVNRLTTNLHQHFHRWALSLEEYGFKLVWEEIKFRETDNQLENPDTTNGNLKFWFVFNGVPWNTIHD